MSIAERKDAYRDIHIAAKQAGLTDRREYENVLVALTGQRSCKDMRPDELDTVRAFLKDAAESKTEYTGPRFDKPVNRVSDEEAKAVLG